MKSAAYRLGYKHMKQHLAETPSSLSDRLVKQAHTIDTQDETISVLYDALLIAKTAIEQRLGLSAQIAGNGPTVGTVIERALQKVHS